MALRSLPNVTRLSPNVIRVLGCNPGVMTLQGTNTYLIGTGERRVLLDTGDGQQPDYLVNLKATLAKNQTKISNIIVSHWHNDHIGGLQEVLKLATDDCQVFKFRRTDTNEEDNAISELTDKQVIEVEGATLQAIHTPGHTTDHAILHLEQENAVFSGDCILGEGTTVFEDLSDYMKSLQVILDLQPQIIYPGHGSVIEDPVDRLKYYISHRLEREQQIWQVISSNSGRKMSPMDVAMVVYEGTPIENRPAASIVVSHYLKKMQKEGKVKEDEDGRFWVESS